MSVATNLCRNISSRVSCRQNWVFFLVKHQEISSCFCEDQKCSFMEVGTSGVFLWCFNKTKAQLLDRTWLQTTDGFDGKLLAVTELIDICSEKSGRVLSDR